MKTLRWNIIDDWRGFGSGKRNEQFIGFMEFLMSVEENLYDRGIHGGLKGLEIGSYMGESTKMIASTGLFNNLVVVEPHTGKEEFNEITGHDWSLVEEEFKQNTKYFNFIDHRKDFSYNVVPNLPDNYFDFIYIDGEHGYEAVKKDLTMCLPKLKNGGMVAGHDYSYKWKGVWQACDDIFDKQPDRVFLDSSWVFFNVNKA